MSASFFFFTKPLFTKQLLALFLSAEVEDVNRLSPADSCVEVDGVDVDVMARVSWLVRRRK
jgi:hypothetical protein